jgi:hypothetical protein
MSVENHNEMILTGENRTLGEKRVPVLLCPPPGVNPDIHDERPATNRLNHGTDELTI